MCDKNKVYQLYFIEKLKVVDIAKIEGVSQPAITQILQQFPEYKQEKERRKKENKIKNRNWTNEYKKQQRQLKKLQKEAERQEDEAIMWALQELQKQNAVAMSKRRKLQGNILWEAYLSGYRYDPEYVNRAGRKDPSYVWREDVPFFDEGDKSAKRYKRIPVHTSSAAAVIYEERNRVESEKWESTTEKEALM
ncbi:hypothetical protein SAMN02746089_02577 [Caldanaerobius fijiensis DSM 17918]|uniref:Uncharacterized protein n=1 Tax=Caldanaerobius fijiensis DSM 17918 TaxID=1121256 RepID=A0A1M5ELM2_9THEO|nr:hypothetical protein SAMN02746089_02577 [Caldanaerobius fijiensis DSM 17918]